MSTPTLFSVSEALEPIAPKWAAKIKKGKLGTIDTTAKMRLSNNVTCIAGEAWGFSDKYAHRSIPPSYIESNPDFCLNCSRMGDDMFQDAFPDNGKKTYIASQKFLSTTMDFIKHFRSKHVKKVLDQKTE